MFIRQRYRIYPKKAIQPILNQWIGCGRFIWNYMLSRNQKHYSETNKFLFTYDMNTLLPQLKKEEQYKWLKDCPSQILQQKCQDLGTSISEFIKKNKRFPKFKSKRRDESGVRFTGYKLDNNTIQFPKLKNKIKIVIDRPLLGKPGFCTLIKDKVGDYFVSFSVDIGDNFFPKTIDIKQATNLIGIDVGIKSFAVTSDGEYIENPKFYRKSENKLKRLHKKHSRKQKQSKNREKSRRKLAKAYRKVTNQRINFVKQTASLITKENDCVFVENLNVKAMVKNHKLAKSLSDVCFGRFLSELQWQCKKRGKIFHKINRFFPSSKTCHVCGTIKDDLTLSDRTYVCESCGMSIDRDLNAAINILNQGLNELQINKNTVGTTEINACQISLSKGKRGQETADL